MQSTAGCVLVDIDNEDAEIIIPEDVVKIGQVGGLEGVERGPRGGPEGAQRGPRGGPEGAQRG